jgi:hypothetical protein
MAKSVPPWLLSLLQIVEQLLAGLLGNQQKARAKPGCDPTTDPECLSLDAAIKAAETAKATLATHAALCCQDGQ